MSLHEQARQTHRPLHIVITGSSQGIGLEAAKILLSQGHVVYHACRSEERAREALKAAGGGVVLTGCACDLSDLNAVRQFAKAVEQRVPRLDALCLNAGIAPASSSKTKTTPQLTAQGLEACVGVNHLGHFLLAQLLHNKLKANGGGRLVVTASSVHDPEQAAGKSGGQTATLGDLSGLGVNLTIQPNGAKMVDGAVNFHSGKVYKDSKLCNILMCRHYAARNLMDNQQRNNNNNNNIIAVCFNPGFIPTTSLFDSLRQESWWKAQALTLFAHVMGFAVPLPVAGQRLAYLTTSPEITSGGYYTAPAKSKATRPEDGFVMTEPSKEARDKELARKLWEKSLEVVQEWL